MEALQRFKTSTLKAYLTSEIAQTGFVIYLHEFQKFLYPDQCHIECELYEAPEETALFQLQDIMF